MRGATLLLYLISLPLLALARPQDGSVTAPPAQPTSTCRAATPKPIPNPPAWPPNISAMWSWFHHSTPASNVPAPSTTTTTYTPGGGTVYSTTTITSYVDPPRPTSTKVVFVTARPPARRSGNTPAGVIIVPTTPAKPEPVHFAPLSRRRNLRPQLTALPSPGDLYVCTDPGFSGTCTYIHSTTYKCHNMPPHLVTYISAIRPDRGQRCSFFTKWGCEQLDAPWMNALRWPGASDLSLFGLDDAVLSWECWEDDCEGVQREGGCYENADGTPKQP